MPSATTETVVSQIVRELVKASMENEGVVVFGMSDVRRAVRQCEARGLLSSVNCERLLGYLDVDLADLHL